MKTSIYEHRSGLRVIPEDVLKDVISVVEEMNPVLSKNTVTQIKKGLKKGLEIKGWSGEYRLDANSKITISSYMRGVGMCVQTGNVGRIYADLLKLQALYLKGNICSGIILTPQSDTAKELGYNMANYERLVRELPIFSQVITMPIVVIGFNAKEEK